MSTTNPHFDNFDQIISRIMEVKGFTQEAEVAEFLGFSRTAFSQRKKRQSIPIDKIAIVCERDGLDFGWIMGGEEKPSNVGRRIEEYRMNLRLKPGEFASIVGIDRQMLRQIEDGAISPDQATLKAIINKTDISRRWLYTGKGAHRKGDNTTGEGQPFLVNEREGLNADLMWKVLQTIQEVIAEIKLDGWKLSEAKRITIRDLLYEDTLRRDGQPDYHLAQKLCELTYCVACGKKVARQRWQERWGIRRPLHGRLEDVTIFVKAAPGTECPVEGMPREHITDSKPSKVNCTEYYRALVDDGSLIIVDPKDLPKSGASWPW